MPNVHMNVCVGVHVHVHTHTQVQSCVSIKLIDATIVLKMIVCVCLYMQVHMCVVCIETRGKPCLTFLSCYPSVQARLAGQQPPGIHWSPPLWCWDYSSCLLLRLTFIRVWESRFNSSWFQNKHFTF